MKALDDAVHPGMIMKGNLLAVANHKNSNGNIFTLRDRNVCDWSGLPESFHIFIFIINIYRNYGSSNRNYLRVVMFLLTLNLGNFSSENEYISIESPPHKT